MFLIDRINLENELHRKSLFLKSIEAKLNEKREDKQVELKVLVMESIGELNRKLYGAKSVS